jgi:hypothetical protein
MKDEKNCLYEMGQSKNVKLASGQMYGCMGVKHCLRDCLVLSKNAVFLNIQKNGVKIQNFI